MFTNLTQHLQTVIKAVTGTNRISADNIKDTIRDIRIALLEADVALPVVKDLLAKVQEQALGQEVLGSLTPGQAFIKILNDSLIACMGYESSGLNLSAEPPVVILIAGLQGAGKTTTAGKLAWWLRNQQKKSVLLVSTDIYRPAAQEQLAILAKKVEVEYYQDLDNTVPELIAKHALQYAQSKLIDTVIVDTAGRLEIDEALMLELQTIHQQITPHETLLVVDSMTGQHAAQVAQKFDTAIDLTGIILSKTDGDARGGAALSIRQITGKPIKFMGIGEKLDNLELFHPERIASRILGMGDVISLVEEVSKKFDSQKAVKLTQKLQKGKDFSLEDFQEYLHTISKMGGMMSIMGKLPMNLPHNLNQQLNENMLKRNLAIINSMTNKEKRYPAVIKGSHKKRIAAGSGTSIQAINQLLKQFGSIQKILKKAKGTGGILKMINKINQSMPKGFIPPQ